MGVRIVGHGFAPSLMSPVAASYEIRLSHIFHQFWTLHPDLNPPPPSFWIDCLAPKGEPMSAWPVWRCWLSSWSCSSPIPRWIQRFLQPLLPLLRPPHSCKGRSSFKQTEFLWFFLSKKGGVGSPQSHHLMSIHQVICGMPKSGAKTCFIKWGRWYLINYIQLHAWW